MAQESEDNVFETVSLDYGDAETRFGVVEAVIEEIEKNIEIPVVNKSTNPFEVKNVDKLPYSEGKSDRNVHFTKLIISTNELDPSVAEIRVVTEERDEPASEVMAGWSENSGQVKPDVVPPNITAEPGLSVSPVSAACVSVVSDKDNLGSGQANLESGQANLGSGQANLESGQANLGSGQANLESGQANLGSGQAQPLEPPANPKAGIKVEADLLQMLGQIVPIAMQPLFPAAFTPADKKSEPTVTSTQRAAHPIPTNEAEDLRQLSNQQPCKGTPVPSAQNIAVKPNETTVGSSQSAPVPVAPSPTVGIIVGEDAMSEISLPPVMVPGSSHFEEITYNGTPHHRVRISIDHRSKANTSTKRTTITVILVIILVVAAVALCVYQFVLKAPSS